MDGAGIAIFRKWMMLVIFLAHVGAWASSSMQYFHLEGSLPLAGVPEVSAHVQSLITDPLDRALPHIKRFYWYQINGQASFFVNVVAEPLDDEGDQALQAYRGGLESTGFMGLPVVFKDVNHITEGITLSAGLHVPNAPDDSFVVNSTVNRVFSMTSLADWEDFTNRLGNAFLSRQSDDFLTYLKDFFADPTAYQDYSDQVLAKDDVVVAELMPMIVLEDGTVVGHQEETSPFFDVPFIRSCWSPDYENGVCRGAKP